eukprot:TRINITY_DN881_c0_g1_i3.p1 TRINITY_DN881_c0_g1~~TRINITY_DN881_c0_g1_i3.p1  ORF type:complete len:564 (+),score=212.82 TRINITY_DN881_c0_g1_i3:106-1797(+)
MSSVSEVEAVELSEKERLRREKKERKKAKLALQETEKDDAEEAPQKSPENKKKRKEVSQADENGEQMGEVKEPAEKKKKKNKKPVEEADETEEAKECGIQKNFYAPAASLANFSRDEVEAFRQKHSMTVSGKDSDFPNFKPARTFAESGLPENVLGCCSNFQAPTPIQAQAWPIILSGRDVVGIAETGSGKTLAFSLPGMVHILAQPSCNSPKNPGPVMLVLAPTRELAMQISDVCVSAGEPLGLRTVILLGGMPRDQQVKALKRGAAILVATPGRLLDILRSGDATLNRVTFFVLDEADRMLDMGFLPDIREVVSLIPSPARQTLMFSATWPAAVQALASEFQKNPVKITIGSEDLTANQRIQQIVEVFDDPRAKDRKLEGLLKQYHKKNNKIIIFCLYKKEAARVEQYLQSRGMKAAAIHGDKPQNERNRVLEKFKDGTTPLLVATDVAARGLDIPNVEYVINYTFPLTIEDYVHRIGRTGRAGKKGVSHTFFTPDDKAHSGSLINILKEANQPVPEELLQFGVHTKKKTHHLYGNHFKENDNQKPMREKSHVKFDAEDDE